MTHPTYRPLTAAERDELSTPAHRLPKTLGRTRHTVRQLVAVLFVIAALAASALAGPDADAATRPTGASAYAAGLELSPWLPPCDVEDGSDCTDPAGDWTAVRVAPGAVCVDFRAGHDTADYCTADAYPPAGAPEWAAMKPELAADLNSAAAVDGGPAAWMACAWRVTPGAASDPVIVCPNGSWHPGELLPGEAPTTA